MSDEGSQVVGVSSVIVVAIVLFLFIATAFIFFMYVFFKSQWRSSTSSSAITRYQFDFAERDSVSAPRTSLDSAILHSLPVYIYKAENHSDATTLECAVCLSEVVDGEKTRLLPKCNHEFHLDCIDMWFHSHSTCPLCRNPVAAAASSSDLVIDIPSRRDTEEETKLPVVTRLKSFKRLFSIGNSSTSTIRQEDNYRSSN